MDIRPATIVLKTGDKGTHGGFPVVVVRHYDGNMYEMRFPGGLSCVSAADFVPSGLTCVKGE